MTEKQQQFDFQRSDQLGLIDEAHIDSQTVGKDRVRGTHIRHVLRVIDSHGRGREAYPSIETIARETSLSVRTVKRAIAALISLSLVIVSKQRPPCGPVPVNHYRIVWSELSLLVQRKRATIEAEREAAWGQSGTMHGASLSTPWGQSGTMHRASNPEHGASNPEHGASLSKHGASLSIPWGQSGTQSAIEAQMKTPPPCAHEPPDPQEEEKEKFAKGESDDAVGSDDPVEASYPPSSPPNFEDRLVLVRTERKSLAERFREEQVWDVDEILPWVLPRVGEQYLLDLLAYFRQHRSDWTKPGAALGTRLKRSNVNLAIDDGWPPRNPAPPPPEKRKSPEQINAERQAFLRSRAEARQAAMESESLGDIFRKSKEPSRDE